ncbi:polysaccharide deacetylase family protein [Aidingimonas lacisalsi]|uniref:polysaccharide deacetylase family protein n=1 Tax=Aidingimonas lacisalsi TaxID=2604086 RepID=UPI0011D1868E|nr:polysaccharide deacetylase family protein [Aidingimonas lacisalsi]
MSQPLTIVMYHYVRPLRDSRYPSLKALDVQDFAGQLDYLQQHYCVVRMEDVIASAKGEASLPENAALLTFDDGYRDHYDHVFPLLVERGLQGSFFPPASAIRERRMLDVNKIHFVLASVDDHAPLVDAVFRFLDTYRERYGLESNETYYQRHCKESRYDGPEVTFIKRLLQKGLPEALRAELVDALFHRFVTDDESAFADELYMSVEELRKLHEGGMYLGSHGDRHEWLNTLPGEAQQREIDASLSFLAELGIQSDDWVMCYPYGGYNDSLLAVLRDRGCALGLTVEVGVADLTKNDSLLLPRLDTNDLPIDGEALPNNGTCSAITTYS